MRTHSLLYHTQKDATRCMLLHEVRGMNTTAHSISSSSQSYYSPSCCCCYSSFDCCCSPPLPCPSASSSSSVHCSWSSVSPLPSFSLSSCWYLHPFPVGISAHLTFHSSLFLCAFLCIQEMLVLIWWVHNGYRGKQREKVSACNALFQNHLAFVSSTSVLRRVIFFYFYQLLLFDCCDFS